MSLFRQEAVDHATRRLAGDVIIHSSLPRFVALALFTIIVVGAGVFAVTSTYARKETVRGWLTPGAGLIRLSARQSGVVETLHVSEGERVKAGQPVATIRLSNAIAAGDSYIELSRSLVEEVDAAESLAASRRAGLGADKSKLFAQKESLANELTEANKRVSLLASMLSISRAALDRSGRLFDQGALSQRELEAQRTLVLQTERDLSDARAETLRLQREMGEISATIIALPIAVAQAQAQAAAARATLGGRQAEAEATATSVIIATVDGQVSALPVHVGDVAQAGSVVAMLTPANSPLEAELAVPTRAAGFIEPGQNVRLMYDAFPHQKFGAAEGMIRSVSQAAMTPEDIRIPGVQVGEPMFIVRVKLKTDKMTGYGRDFQLRPGLMLAADVVLDRRSLLEWLLDPLFAIGRRA